MTIITRFNFSDNKQITTQIADNESNHLWTAYAQNANGICLLKKQGAFNPYQTYYTVSRYVTNINALDYDIDNLYVAYDDSVYLGEILDKLNPLTSTTYISKGTFAESPIDVKVNGTDLWFLLPGNISGQNAKLLKYDTDGIYQDEIELTTVVDAKNMVIDENDDIWIITYTDPVQLVRVFELSGGSYDFDITNIA